MTGRLRPPRIPQAHRQTAGLRADPLDVLFPRREPRCDGIRTCHDLALGQDGAVGCDDANGGLLLRDIECCEDAQRHQWAYLFGAARAGSEAAFALVMPTVNTDTMQVFLDRFAETLAKDENAVMVLDGAGWHGAKALRVPPNVTLAPLPPQSPQLNPMERVWLDLRERFRSLRLVEGDDAIVDPCCSAWNAIAEDADRIRSLCLYPWIKTVIG